MVLQYLLPLISLLGCQRPPILWGKWIVLHLQHQHEPTRPTRRSQPIPARNQDIVSYLLPLRTQHLDQPSAPAAGTSPTVPNSKTTPRTHPTRARTGSRTLARRKRSSPTSPRPISRFRKRQPGSWISGAGMGRCCLRSGKRRGLRGR